MAVGYPTKQSGRQQSARAVRSTLMATFLISILSGCTLWMPRHDPAQAWIELAPREKTELQALAVDGRPLRDGRYFQVRPGPHTLEVRYRFQVQGTNIGPDHEPLPRDCKLSLEYDRFDAGVRYRLVAGHNGFRPWVRLEDPHRSVLARATEQGCGNLARR